MLLVWIIFFEMAVLYFASAVLLNSRLAAPRWGWVQFWLMLVGALMTNVAVLQGNSSVMFTSYAPLLAAPHFYLGLVLFAVGALIGCAVFFGTLVVAKDEKTYEGSVPLVTFGAITAAIIAVFTLACGAIILIPTFLWSLGIISGIDPLMYKLVWWGMGHSSQQINVSAHVAVWYAIGAMVLGAKPISEKVSRMAFLMYILFLQLASAHHMLVEPGVSSSWKIFNTSYAMYLAVLGSMIHGMTVPGAIEAAQRAKGYNKGLFEWLRKAPWGNPAFAGMFLSLVMFGFLGGISGVVMGTEQINLIMHNTLYVPGHFHATVVAGTTLAFMAITYLLVPLIFRREVMFRKVAQLQPYIFGLGVAGISLFMMGAGTLGVPRRHWDITFADALTPVPVLARGVPDAGAQRHVRDHGRDRRRDVHSRRRLLGLLRPQDRRQRSGAARSGVRRGIGRGRGALRQRGNAQDPRHDRAGRRVLRVVRPVLLRELEVPCRGLAAAVGANVHQAVAQDADLAANRASWRSTVEVFKPRIALEIMFAGIAGVAMAQGPGLPPCAVAGSCDRGLPGRCERRCAQSPGRTRPRRAHVAHSRPSVRHRAARRRLRHGSR